MIRPYLSLLFTTILVSCSMLHAANRSAEGSASAEEQPIEYTNEELPSVVIAYGLLTARYGEFRSLESDSQNVLVRLGKNIDALPGDISTRLAFAHKAFIVQDNIVGHHSGFIREKNRTLEQSRVPFESILFVSTPIESFGQRILVILSSVGPEQTSIVAVDNRLNVELLYDSFNKNTIVNAGNVTTIGSVYSVHVVRRGYFFLEERVEPGGRGFVSPYRNRTFIVDATKGSFRISIRLK